MTKKYAEQGYTLIYVVIILFMLSFLVLYGVNKLYVQRQNLAVSVAVQDLKNMQEAAQNIYLDYGAWPYLNIYPDGSAINFNENILYHYYYPAGNVWRKEETGTGAFTPRPYYVYPDMRELTQQQYPIPLNSGAYSVPEIDPELLLAPFQRSSINQFIQGSLTNYWNQYPSLYPYPAYLKTPYYEFEIMTKADPSLNSPPTNLPLAPDPTSSQYFTVTLKGLDNPQIANQILAYLPGSYDSTSQTLSTVVPIPTGSDPKTKYANQSGRIMTMGYANIYSYVTHPSHNDQSVYPWTKPIPMPVCTNGVVNRDGTYNNYYPYIFFGPVSFKTTYPQRDTYDKNAEMREIVYYKQTCTFLTPTTPNSNPGYWYIGMRTIAQAPGTYGSQARGTLSYFTTCLPGKPSDQFNSFRYITNSSTTPGSATSDIYAITSTSTSSTTNGQIPDAGMVNVIWPSDPNDPDYAACVPQYPTNVSRTTFVFNELSTS